MVFLPDLVDGVLREVWWVRARAGHSMPVCSSFHSYLHILNFLKDVMTSTKRILNMGKLKAIVYLASPYEWDSIRNYHFIFLKYLRCSFPNLLGKYGIPARRNCVIPVYKPGQGIFPSE